MKKKYIAFMEKALSAYSDEHIRIYFDRVKTEGLTEHGFARLTANIGILISHGIREDLRPLFCEMMDFCCKNMPISDAANDFTVREILFCLMSLEERRTFDIEKIVWWKSHFIEIDRDKCYREFIKQEEEDPRNWAFFTLVSEWMRKYCGLCDTEEFVEFQLISQMRRFDENGQYHDHLTNRTPHQPIVYDIAPRMLTAMLLHFGYRGKYYEELRALMKRVTPLTLASVSVTGDVAFGGRSNQFIHNEAMLCTFLEFAANLFYEDGDMETAKKCKAAIKLAAENMEYWFSQSPISHVKNRFPFEKGFGCEDYAYFDKYMITAASNIYPAYLICNEEIPCGEWENDAEVTVTSDYFHKIFLRSGDYYSEIELNADPHYDCSGVGRLHRRGASSVICLSVPCAKHPNYVIDVENPEDISLCPGFVCEDSVCFATEGKYTLLDHGTKDGKAFALLEFPYNERVLRLNICVKENGITAEASGEGEVALMLPYIDFDGREHSSLKISEGCARIDFDGSELIYSSDSPIRELKRKGGNRNGIYKTLCATGTGKVKVNIEIQKKG